MPERARIPRHRLEKSLHEPLKTVALVAFGKGNSAVFGEDVVEGHGGGTPEKEGHIPCYPGTSKKKIKKQGGKCRYLPALCTCEHSVP